MSQVNHNPNSFDARSDSELVKTIEITVDEVVRDEAVGNSDRLSSTKENKTANASDCNKQKIDWHKIAHKLREHNRKLLKQVFQVEQEKAELENRVREQIEQSYSSDATIAKQAAQIEHSLEQISLLGEQLELAQQEARGDRDTLEHLARKLELSQKQTARLERECALLQESLNEKTCQLIERDKQIKELSTLNEQSDTLQNSSVDIYNRQASRSNEITRVKSQPIQVWSAAMRDKLSLPAGSRALKAPSSQWPAPAIAKTKSTKKVESLAAVELPKFPRQT